MDFDTHTARTLLERAIEDGIALLDLLDPDPDLEPSLGSYKGTVDKCDLEGDSADDEPSLGSLGGIRQDGDRWAGAGQIGYGLTDLELDKCDDEDNGDTELNGDELDFSDHSSGMDGGIGDEDGLAEQAGLFDGADERWRYLSYEDRRTNEMAAADASRRLRGKPDGQRIPTKGQPEPSGAAMKPVAVTDLPRRAFLRGLATLPLVGGAVELLGNPSAVAMPVSRQLMFEYRQWLAWEKTMAERQLFDGWSAIGGYLEEHRAYDVARHLQGDSALRLDMYTGVNAGLRSHAYRWHEGAPPASTRAALVLSAVGCDWRGAYLP